uniref:FAD-dependent oxidoreductase 2 FAD binding domain-containing protein n=1 Tax=Plectus sambesii TaxID=2011161 RepID=A0A914VUR6_9BILA
MHLVLLLATLMSSSLALSRMPKDDDPVIVVGGGLAGLSAAIEIVNQGGKVILIDSQKDVGGNSAKASSGINGCGTAAQKIMKIDDSTDKFYADTMSAGDRENNPALVDTLVHDSAESVQFLIDHGVNLMDINLCGGHSVPRTHWIPSPKEGKPSPVGVTIIRALKQKLLDLQAANPDAVTIKLETEVYGLVTWNDYITGVNTVHGGPKREEINGKAVILATGGYSNDHEKDSLLAEFAPKMIKFPTTNGPFAKGSGVKIARAMGAQLVDMQYVQVHPTAFIDPAQPTDRTKFLAAEALRGKGALLLNDKGVRFGNELGRRDYLTERILEDCALDKEANAKVAYMVMNEEAVQGFGPPAFNFYWKIKKFFTLARCRIFDLIYHSHTLRTFRSSLSSTHSLPTPHAAIGSKCSRPDFGEKNRRRRRCLCISLAILPFSPKFHQRQPVNFAFVDYYWLTIAPPCRHF